MQKKYIVRLSDQERIGEDVFKSLVICILLKNRRPAIASIQGMVNRIFLVSTFRPGHVNMHNTNQTAGKES
ncbi:hypothetical protein Q31b_37850 [Novipirellula aureliae]|uniref:Uncharacterized protein n=1 Tax=Novipirellula aureliae TaxID=2527966 RepID=A0A5C6DS43_9BACT|nr:hypothetical protein [Novipirellula aureliae]TWU38707.1 hypothetical protein Q31b_37850 [Novipirellula aureliae]